MNPINAYRERISKANLSAHLHFAAGWTMRVWREEPTSSSYPAPGRVRMDDDIFMAIGKFVDQPVSQLELARAILALERVNAVEITDMAGFGEVLYKDWP